MNVGSEITDLKRRETVSEKRIGDLECEVKDIRQLAAAMSCINQKVDGLSKDMDEIKCDIKAISAHPGKLWDKIAAAALGALATGLVAAVLAVAYAPRKDYKVA